MGITFCTIEITCIYQICYFLAGAPRTVNFIDVTQSLLEVEGVKEVHDLRMWSLSMNKIAIAVHLAVGLYIVLYLFTFFPSIHVCPLAWPIFANIEHYFSSVLMIMLSFLPLFVIHAHFLIKFGVKCYLFPLYIQRRTEIQWMCWG